MKTSRNFNSERFTFNLYYCLFVEWLREHRLYGKFVKNLARSSNFKGSINEIVFDHFSCLIKSPFFSMSQAITSAFPFISTPEGFDFWDRVSDDWFCFFNDFSRKINL